MKTYIDAARCRQMQTEREKIEKEWERLRPSLVRDSENEGENQ